MGKGILILLVFMLNSILFSQINFNLDFSFEKINIDDELTNLQFFDYNNDDDDEIVVGFTNNCMRLVCYNLLGDTLFTYTEEFIQDTIFQKSQIFKIENNNYFLTISTYTNIDDKDKILIRLYSLVDFALVNEFLYEVIIPPCDFFHPPEIKSLFVSDNLIAYLGYRISSFSNYNLFISSKLACFSLNDSISHLADVDESGESIMFNEITNQIISTGYNFTLINGVQSASCTRTYFTTFITNDFNLEYYNVNTISGNLDDSAGGYFWNNYPNNYKIISTSNPDSNILYFQLLDDIVNNEEIYNQTFIKYTSDFLDTLWIKYDTMTGNEDIFASTWVNTNLGSDYIMYFKENAENNDETFYEIRSSGSGNIVSNGISEIYPFSVKRNIDGQLYLFEVQSNDYGYNVYTIDGEIFLSNDDNQIVHSEIRLCNFPNPFNPSTTIEFSIQNDSEINLSIYNIKGQIIKTLADNEFNQGSYSVIWNGDDEFYEPVSSGVYYYKLNVNGKTEVVKKCLLLK